jgi:hypothetical protein
LAAATRAPAMVGGVGGGAVEERKEEGDDRVENC